VDGPETRNPDLPLHEQPEVHARRWLILSAMCLSLVLVVMAVSGLNVALPTIQQDLDTTGTELLWIVASYAIVFAGLLLPAGAIGDKFGRKGALQAGLVVSAVGAIVAAAGSTSVQVIAGRAIMGGGAAFIMPATLSIISVVFPPQERFKAIAIWAGFAGAGGAIGPIVSGVLLTGWWIVPEFGWPATFLVNVAVIVLALLATSVLAPKTKEAVSTPLDPVGAGLSIVGISALLFAIIEGPDLGWSSSAVLGSFATAAAFFVVFIWWEIRTENPMLPMSFFRNRRFSVGSGVVSLVFFVMFGFFLLITLYLQFVLDYTPLEAGVATLPLALTVVLFAPRTASLGSRFGTGPVMAIGFVLVAGGLGLLTMVSVSTPYAHLALAFVLLGAGLALASAPATGNIITSVPADKAGVGSAMNDITRELGGAIGIAVGGSLVATIYSSAIDLDSLGLNPIADTVARESIGGALGVSAGIGGDTAAQIVSAANEAFTQAFASTMGIFAILSLLAGFATWWSMRGHEMDWSASEEEWNGEAGGSAS
jgi:DHA2 family multidrug resistance protein-like MFS transporter